MKTKDIQVGQPYFYQKGRAEWSQRVNGDGMAFVLSTETFVSTSYRDRGMPQYVREADYTGYRHDGKGLLAITVHTNVHEGDVPEAARKVAASVTLAQLAMLDFRIPQHIEDELRQHHCFADIVRLQPQTLLGEWDEVYTERKAEAQARREREVEREQAQRTNAERWETMAAEIGELLGEKPYLSTISSMYTGDLRDARREIDIDVLEKLVRLAQDGESYRLLIDTTGTG
jgi:hypothetical protein